MERFCVSHDCHRLGCDVEMVQSDVGEWVRHDDAQAEIARLRAALKAEREACDAWRAASRTGGYESLKSAEEYHDSRRAAEGKQ